MQGVLPLWHVNCSSSTSLSLQALISFSSASIVKSILLVFCFFALDGNYSGVLLTDDDGLLVDGGSKEHCGDCDAASSTGSSCTLLAAASPGAVVLFCFLLKSSNHFMYGQNFHVCSDAVGDPLVHRIL